jgi:hypothetical protein
LGAVVASAVYQPELGAVWSDHGGEIKKLSKVDSFLVFKFICLEFQASNASAMMMMSICSLSLVDVLVMPI